MKIVPPADGSCFTTKALASVVKQRSGHEGASEIIAGTLQVRLTSRPLGMRELDRRVVKEQSITAE